MQTLPSRHSVRWGRCSAKNGERSFLLSCFSLTFLLEVFCTAPQVTECLGKATKCSACTCTFILIVLVLGFIYQNVSLIELFLLIQDTFWWFFLEKFQVSILYFLCMIVMLYEVCDDIFTARGFIRLGRSEHVLYM